MISSREFRHTFRNTRLQDWCDDLLSALPAVLEERTHGDQQRWQQAVERLPVGICSHIDIHDGALRLVSGQAEDSHDRIQLRHALEDLIPWRKGPFDVFGVFIDTEWRSDKKWQRIESRLSPLQDRLVLDVGCGNGYYAWRMALAGARVLGIDPSRLFLMQYLAIQKLMLPRRLDFQMLPFGIQHMPANMQVFDTVFSMGVLYHRKSPIEHLQELKNCLRPGGELVLETLIIEGDEGMSLMPEQRYAKMRNVWFIPSVATLELWLRRTGFESVRVVDVSDTTTDEQRATDWMRFESLPDFLDSRNPSLTVEGYPAPRRAVLVASVPGHTYR